MGKKKTNDQQAGQHAVPESGAAVPADAGVHAGEPADPVPGDPGEPAADGAGNDPAQDPAPAVAEPAVDVGTQEAEGVNDGQAQGQAAPDQPDSAAQGQRDPDGAGEPADDGRADEGGDGSFSEAGNDDGHAIGDGLHDDSNTHIDHGAAGDAGPADDEVKNPFDLTELARSVGFAGRVYAAGGSHVDLDDAFTRSEAVIMADFVRANPDAPLMAMYKHLEIAQRLQPTTPNAEDMLVLSLFHAAVTCGLAFERAQAAEASEPEAPRTAVWPGDRSFKVQEPAFSPTGFSPR